MATPDIIHPAALSPAALRRDCRETRTRRSGPGGQHRNKTETAVVLFHEPTGISAEACERRSQAENRAMALARLRLKLALEYRLPARSAPSPCWQSRCRGRALVISPGHADFPTLLAEALDQLAAHAFALPPAASVLGVTPTQLLKLVKRSLPAWTALNRLRAESGLRELR